MDDTLSPLDSAQVCGCDPGCKPEPYFCKIHREALGFSLPSLPGVTFSGAGTTITGGTYADTSNIWAGADDKLLGLGGAPVRATTLPESAEERKKYPIGTGVLDYFPDAIAAIAYVSWLGNEQHNPGKPLHWDRSKSADEYDAMQRHGSQRGTRDKDGARHSAKMAWRSLALLQKEIEAEQG